MESTRTKNLGNVSAISVIALFFFTFSGCSSFSPQFIGNAPPTSGDGVPIYQIALQYSNVFFIAGPQPILIESGAPGECARLEKALAEKGHHLKEVRLIILTHGHADHAGGAAELRKVSGAKVAMQIEDAHMAREGKNDYLKATGLMGNLLRPIVDLSYPAYEPDILIQEKMDLAPYGIAGEVIHLPGHTPGSIAILLKDHTAFVGDVLLGGDFGGALSPQIAGEHYYEEDLKKDHENIQWLLSQGIEKFYLGHGGPVSAASVREAFPKKFTTP